MFKTFLGYDAGTTSAAIAVIGGEKAEAIFVPIMGKAYVDVLTLLPWITSVVTQFPAIAIMELPQARTYRDPQGIVRKQNTDTTFRCFGQVHALLTMKGIGIIEVAPSTWKAKMGLNKKGKEESLRLAMQQFPEVDLHRKKDHNRAEALLMADYGRIFHG